MTLEILTADELLPFRHGFLTRSGGVSSGIFQGLNCGLGSSDQRDAVLTNRRLVARAMGVAPERLITLNQTHSARVATVDDPSAAGGDQDAMVTRRPGLALAILTADCQPVLFADARAGVIGAAHAGWKGALGGILEATIAAMEALGAERRRISAVIGPCISQAAYEVGPEFRDRFVQENPENARFFAPGQEGKFMFDLPGLGLSRLQAAGIASARWLGHCTYHDPDRFYSYRRATHAHEADYGRLISVITI